MSKENAEKFIALYQQHKAIAKQLEQSGQEGEEKFLVGLARVAKQIGLECSADELRELLVPLEPGDVSGGMGATPPFFSLLGCPSWGQSCDIFNPDNPERHC